MNAKDILKRAKSKRNHEYRYRPGSVVTSCTPKKLASEAEQALCAMLVKQVTMKEAARLMGVSIPTVSRAVRAFYWRTKQ